MDGGFVLKVGFISRLFSKYSLPFNIRDLSFHKNLNFEIEAS